MAKQGEWRATDGLLGVNVIGVYYSCEDRMNIIQNYPYQYGFEGKVEISWILGEHRHKINVYHKRVMSTNRKFLGLIELGAKWTVWDIIEGLINDE